MHDAPGKPQAQKPKAKSPKSREDRLKAALKANMGRRKLQGATRAQVGADNDKEDE